ncbi:MAG: hypothetical protein AAF206_19785, partial [Bacteroidota bacterium]
MNSTTLLGTYRKNCRLQLTHVHTYLLAILLSVCVPKLTHGQIHVTPACGSVHEFNWSSSPAAGDEYNWPASSLSNTFTNIDGSGVNMTLTFSGETSALGSWNGGGGATTPILGTDVTFSATEALQYFTNGFSAGGIIMALSFSSPLQSIGFDIMHINGAGPNGDNYTVTATDGLGNTIYPDFSIVGDASFQDQGNGVLNSNNNAAYFDIATAGVNFSDPDGITSIQIVWSDCDACSAGTVHGSGLGALSFCTTVEDLDTDGIPDVLDIDDDNDGILDITESCGLDSIEMSNEIVVEIQTDDYGSETSWRLVDEAGNIVMSGGPYTNTQQLIRDTLRTDFGLYSFTIFDSYGDGLCCTYGAGHYKIFSNDRLILGNNANGNIGGGIQTTIRMEPDYFPCLSGDPGRDADGDGVLNFADADFLSLNAAGVASSLDTDGDGVIDLSDLDADNDGIVDNTEAQATGSYVGPAGNDTDGDGLDDAYDPDCAPCGAVTGNPISPVDTEWDGVADYLDSDSDEDGIADSIEGHDTNGDGLVDGNDSPNADTGLSGAGDNDGDGILNGFDNDDTNRNPTNGNLTAESHPDVRYGTAEQDWREGLDTDADGIVDTYDVDDDNDGLPDDAERYVCGTNWQAYGQWGHNNGTTFEFESFITGLNADDERPGPGWDTAYVSSSLLIV